MAETMGAIGTAGFFANRVQVAVPQAHLHLVQLAQVHPFLGDPFGQARVVAQGFAAGSFRKAGHESFGPPLSSLSETREGSLSP